MVVERLEPMEICMSRSRALFLVVTLCGVLVLPLPARAANREHQQMMADIRMLQEQSQQIQAALTALADAVKAINTRLDTQQDATRRAFADSKVQGDQIANDLRVIRERVDETNVRLTSLSQEVDGLRLAMPTFAPPPVVPGGGDAAPGATGAPLPAAPPSAVGLNPQRLYDQAWADYAAGQWNLAIEGFQTYIKTFPKSDLADDAQFYMGETYYQDSKFNDAIAAYNELIASYTTSNQLPSAYYKRGLCYDRLGQTDRARESFEYVIKTFPDSDAGRLARQSLDRLGRKP